MANTELVFEMERQFGDNWCWAANTASISKFYSYNSPWHQCVIVNHCWRLNNCCGGRRPPIHCDNDGWYLDRSLAATDNLEAYDDNIATFNVIKAEIDRGRVLAVRIEWSDGNGHFVSIFGYDDSTRNPYLHIGDPLKEKTLISLNDLLGNYENVGGRWTDTYYTKPAGNTMITFTDLNKGLLEKALSITPPSFLNMTGNLKFAFENLLKSLPHEIFIVLLESLKSGSGPKIKKAGIRLMEKNESNENVIFEYSDNSEDAKLTQIIHGINYTGHYEMNLRRIMDRYLNSAFDFELRIIRQPELKIEAFWLHNSESTDDDIFIPIYTSYNLRMSKRYNWKSFFEKLESLAQERRPSDDKKKGG